MAEKGKYKTTVSIQGEDYIIRSNVSPEEMERLARHVDMLMKKLAGQNPAMSKHKIAVLAALNLAEDLFALREEEGEREKGRDRETDRNELA